MADVGGRLGEAIANLVTENMIKARAQMLDVESDHADRRRNATWEMLEREIADAIKERGITAFTDPELSEETRKAFASLDTPTHQVDFLFNLVAWIGMAISGAFSAAAGFNQQLTQIGMNNHARVVVDPNQAASMIARGFIDEQTGAQWARWNGMQGPQFGPVLQASYNEFSAGELVELYRRNKISLGNFLATIKRLGYRDGAGELLAETVVGPPDSGTIVAGVTQSQLTPGEARDLLAQVGIDPIHFDWIFKTAGQSPPVDLTLNLWNRGLISDAIVDKIILESPIKNEYVDVIKKMRYHWPPMEQTISMVRRGSYTPAQGADRLAKLGFFPDDIKAMIDWATQDKNQATKDLSTAQIIDLYELQLRDKTATVADLVDLGWDATEADWMLSISDVRTMRRKLDRSVVRVRSAYLAHRIDDQAASTALDAMGVPSAARDDLLDTWDVERSVNVQVLSQAQLIAAAKKDIITSEVCGKRLVQLGYSPEDATILMATAGIIDLSKA